MWKKIVHLIESELDSVRYGIERLAGSSVPLRIQTYLGYGDANSLRVSGRVLRQRNLPEAGASDSEWRNFLNMTRNWFTDEVPHARLEARFRDVVVSGEADEEGYFSIELPAGIETANAAMWQEVELTLLDPVGDDPVTARAIVQLPSLGSEFGVISDIDDTVIHTGATDLFEMAKNTLLGNAHTRVVFNGVSALYAALARGIDGRGRNPFFYVTSSPWNVYGLLTEIFELRSIPRGPLFMTDWGIDDEKFLMSGHHSHKKGAIRRVLSFYPELKFILIGDSGQQDPEIYTDILNEFPGRILAVYIRDVTETPRDANVERLAEKADEMGVDLILAEESNAIAAHAVANGWIRECELPAIAGQAQADGAEAIADGADPLS